MNWIRLGNISVFSDMNNIFIAMGKTVIAISAIVGVIYWAVFTGQFLLGLYGGPKFVAGIAFAYYTSQLVIPFCYNCYRFLNTNQNDKQITSIKLLTGGVAGLLLIISSSIFLIGLLSLIVNIFLGAKIVILSIVMFSIGLGIMRFIDERDRLPTDEMPALERR